MGSGVAFLDADGDGWQDILLVNSTTGRAAPARASLPALYRNNRNGTFTDVTARVGPRRRDVRPGRRRRRLRQRRRHRPLHHRARRATACSATTAAALRRRHRHAPASATPGFSTSAAWFDYDRDGRLDLFVANYVEWSIEKDLFCTLDGKTKSYCTPESYKGQSPTLYRNRGDGTFEDVTQKAGLLRPDREGARRRAARLRRRRLARPVRRQRHAAEPALSRTSGTARSPTSASTAGVAFNEAGVARAGMGVDAADYDGSGRPEPRHRQLLERDDGALPRTRGTASSSTRRRPRPSARRRC